MTCAALPLLVALATQTPAQTPRADTLPPRPPALSAGVVPETVTVGDPFRSHLRVVLPRGSRVEFPPVAAGDSLQPLDSTRVTARSDSVFTAVYPLVAWVADEPLREVVTLRVRYFGGETREYRVALRLPVVRSVLPAGDTVRPRPPKGLLLAERPAPSRWWIAALALGLVLAAALAARRLRSGPGAVLPGDPREEALARLDRLADPAASRLPPDRYYAEITRALRGYLVRLDARWGEELTTGELLAAERAGDALDWASLASLLARADPVKFGAQLPAVDEARRFWSDARAWVAANPAPAERKEAA